VLTEKNVAARLRAAAHNFWLNAWMLDLFLRVLDLRILRVCVLCVCCKMLDLFVAEMLDLLPLRGSDSVAAPQGKTQSLAQLADIALDVREL
jgi:hypothetical protein